MNMLIFPFFHLICKDMDFSEIEMKKIKKRMGLMWQ